MKKELLLAIIWLLAPCFFSPTQAQSLVDRVYHNANIMADKLNEVINKAMPEAKAKGIAEEEKKKGRKLTDAEMAEIDKKMQEGLQKASAVMKGMKTAITLEFMSETQAVMKTDMQINEDALKQAGVNWIKRKALKAAMALAPSTEKAEYVIKGDLIIMDPNDEPDTLRISEDGKCLYGKFDKKTNFKLTRTK